jgi:large subunit ribosomal protein L3
MKFLLGKKKEMTQIFDEKGRVSAGTVVSISPLIVTQVKGEKTDGYFAVQLGGFPGKKAANKAMKGHLKELPNFSELIEVRLAAESTMQVGDEVTLANFTVGDKLEISGISKGKGFQGVIKRHGFAGGPRTHGNAHAEREPGSISGGLRSHVPKGMRMGGRMGSDRITVRNLKVLAIDTDKNEMIIKGAVPGRRGTLLEIKAK